MSDAAETFEKFKAFLPEYLSREDRQSLFKDLSNFPTVQNFYLQDSPEELLQGDGWTGFVVVDVDSNERRSVEGLILSNSCDTDVSNDRLVAPRILFAPLIRLTSLEEMLVTQGQPEERVNDYIFSIKRQYVTNVFYLPSGQYGPDESVAYLDDVRPVRLREFLDLEARSRLFRLSMAGFYILLLKLSIHFSRLQEGVRRFPAKAG